MGRTFFSTIEFDKQWQNYGLVDEDRRRLENEIINNPNAGTLIRGAGGLRKIRFSYAGKGKSGGLRVLFVDFVIIERIYLITVYSKNEKEDISIDERKQYKKIIDQTRQALGE